MATVYTIHGAIGVGKSTVLSTIKEGSEPHDLSGKYFTTVVNKKLGVTAIFPEPVHEWKETLSKFYGDKQKNTAEIQRVILGSQARQIEEIDSVRDKVDTILLERSAWDAKNIFVELNKENLTDEEYKEITAECDKLIEKLGDVVQVLVVASKDQMVEWVLNRGLLDGVPADEESIPYLFRVHELYRTATNPDALIWNCCPKEDLEHWIYNVLPIR